MRRTIALLVILLTLAPALQAQDLKVATVTRPPFSMVENGIDIGFSIDLWEALAEDLGRSFEIQRVAEFSELLQLVSTNQVDIGVGNISITAKRETDMDFSHPVFESGLQIMIPADSGSNISGAILSSNFLAAFAAAFALLFAGGMLMWWLERKAQPYFDRPAKEAMFPSFWWALNLVVNGGFEERVPRTFFGRILGVMLVISSLFIVSIFVAQITAFLTISAIQGSVNSVNDLYGKRVGTIGASTASVYMDGRDLRYTEFSNLDNMLTNFEAGELDAIVFDAPILAFYANKSSGKAHLAGSVFLRENYGIALPSGSPITEELNQSLLKLREDGTYNRIYRKWFGVNLNN